MSVMFGKYLYMKKEKSKMEPYPNSKFRTLLSKDDKPRAMVCIYKPKGTFGKCIGLAFCSDDDNWDTETGMRLAYRRAVRAFEYRSPCYVKTYKVAKYILTLRYKSLEYLMKLTNHRVKYFPKGFII